MATRRKYGGTGLGLAISKQLVELTGERIGVESEEGRGSDFRFTVPFDRRQGRERAVPFFRAGAKVLVVDDNATNRLPAMKLLQSRGCTAVEAADGEGALRESRQAASEDTPYRVALPDQHGVAGVLDLFLEDTPRRIESLKKCATRGDLEVAGRQAHSIKGAAGSMGGKALREAAFGVEKAWRDGDAGQLAATTSRLRAVRRAAADSLVHQANPALTTDT